MDIHCPHCDALHWRDECTSKSRIDHLEFGMCCAHGKIKLSTLRIPPQPLYNLFTSNSLLAKEFRTNIVQYNAALAFTSLGVKVDQSIVGHGPSVFRIHGELRHLSGSLLPEESEPPSYSQLYVYDPDLEIKICLLTRCRFFNASCGIITLTHPFINMHMRSYHY